MGPALHPRAGKGEEEEEEEEEGRRSTSVLQDGFVGLVDVLGDLRRSAFQGQLRGERRRGGSRPLAPHQ